jgi:hypothetical protein
MIFGKIALNRSIITLKSHSNISKIPAKAAGERELVGICMAAICRKAGTTDPGNMTQRDLKFLSEQIEARTGVLISMSTIRRLLNGQFSRIPQVATLDAIARFLDHANWQDFRTSAQTLRFASPALTSSAQTAPLASPLPTIPRTARWAYGRPLLVAGSLILATFGIFAVIRIRRPGIGNIDKAQFSAVKVTANELPNTVVFKYNIDQVDADSFFIQQSWDRNRRVRIYKKDNTLTDIYYEPGYHTAKLIANDQVIKTMPVSIPTDRWFYYVKERVAKSIPTYIQAAGNTANLSGLPDLTNTSAIGSPRPLTPQDLANNAIDIHKNNQYLQVYFPTHIETNSDDCDLHFRIRVDPVNNEACPYFMAEIFCQHYFMYFVSMTKGCSSESQAQFGDNVLNGKTHDLSALGSDVRNWQDVEFAISNRKVSIRINHTEVLTADYHQPCGLVTGIGFISNGLAAVDSVKFNGRP